MYISDKFLNWLFKRNILWQMIVLRSRCINICQENSNLGQIQITSHKMCSEQIKCFPVISCTRSLGSWNSNFRQYQLILGVIFFFFFTNLSLFFLKTPNGSSWKHIDNIFQESFWKSGYHVIYQNYEHFKERKKSWRWLLHGQMKLDLWI